MRQKLGQHFLKNPDILAHIASLAAPKDTHTPIIEIGPGKGALTYHLVNTYPQNPILGIEKDPQLVALLKNKFSDHSSLKIIEEDIKSYLQTNQLPSKNIVVGNIPYYLTSYLLRLLEELPHKPEKIVLTIQKEVGERICASTPNANKLSLGIQYWAHPQTEGIIKRSDFSPPPDVDSTIILLSPHKTQENEEKRRDFYRLLNILFQSPRKTILNNLSHSLPLNKEEIQNIIEKIDLNPTSRPQTLTVEDIKNLRNAINDKSSSQ